MCSETGRVGLVLEEIIRTNVNLADRRLGAEGVYCTDEFFAPLSRMLEPSEPVFIPEKFDDHGKWMDGWETRRRRHGGHDHCIVKLAVPGILHAADLDTRHFTGNYPPAASVEGCFSLESPDHDTEWYTLIPARELGPDSRHIVPVDHSGVVSHVRVNIYPDGGIARLRLYGTPVRDWTQVVRDEPADLASALSGAVPVAWSDSHYGHPGNLLRPDKAANMGDGWETRRRREPGNDWCIIALGHPGHVQKIVVDTAHFKGNYPDRCTIQAARLPTQQGVLAQTVVAQSMFWPVLLPEQKLGMDQLNTFTAEHIEGTEAVSHIRVNIIPDGGIGRLRIFGIPGS